MKCKLKDCLLLLLLWLMAGTVAHAVKLTSPNGQYEVSVDGMTYTVKFAGRTIVEPSQLGIDVDNRLFESALGVPRGEHLNWCADMVLKGEERLTCDTTWMPLYGENDRIRDHYNQLVLHYEKGSQQGDDTAGDGYDKRKYYALDIVLRAYDEGIALRYHFPETKNGLFLHVTGERTTFHMPEGTTGWYEEWAQGPYTLRPLKTSEQWLDCERPLLMQLPDGTYVALLEAAMKDFVRGKLSLKADHELQVALYDSADVITPYDTPWRVIMAAERAVDLINHKELVLNLNEPSRVPNTVFINPGKAFRACRLDRATILQSIDYCQAQGFNYVELDAGWYGPEGKVESDARSVAETRDFNIPDICQYARERGIGVWLYVNQRALYRQLDALLPLYRKWGVSGIKFGFVHVGNQQWSTWLHQAVEKCSKHGLMVDIHDEYRPTGLSRTYPNLLTQEGIRGNEEMPDADHNTLLPFTRYLCGPADYTLCYFNSRVKNTKGHQLAMAAVYYSPLQFYFWYDQPFTDKGEAELKFWRDCPTVFDESRALDGEPGQYIVQMRRAGTDYFVGAMTNTEGRTLNIATDFLPKGRYEVEIYNDDPTLDTRTKVRATTMTVSAGQPITLTLQPSGGAALHFRPAGVRTFTHPGLLHTKADMKRMQRLVSRKDAVAMGSFEKLSSDPKAKADYKMRGPYEEIARDGEYAWTKTPCENDFLAAYYNALMYGITGEKAHADKAMEIIRAYATTLQRVRLDDPLCAGLQGFILVNACELMRYGYKGWTSDDTQKTEDLMRRAFLPVVDRYDWMAPYANGNWGGANNKMRMAIGIYCNDTEQYRRASDFYLRGHDNGSLPNYIINDEGQCQESGRDQAHVMLGLGVLAEACEMAWNQGDDLYGALDNRLMKGYEYMSRSNLGFDVPFTCWKDLTGRYHNWQVLADGARGQWRAVLEIAYNHYVGRRHLQMPYTSLALGHYVRPEGAGFTCDNPGFGSLLFYRDTKVDTKGEVPAPPSYRMNEKRAYSPTDEPVIRLENAPRLTLVRNVDCWPEYWDLQPVRQEGNQYEYEPLGAKSRNGYKFEGGKLPTTFIVYQ